ncbi:MAG TPA: hypothetical protein VLM11_13020 [Streptosporangiaceae bacterium]|nr:hypothetical protein [Streptosporangiaceae bacterium]
MSDRRVHTRGPLDRIRYFLQSRALQRAGHLMRPYRYDLGECAANADVPAWRAAPRQAVRVDTGYSPAFRALTIFHAPPTTARRVASNSS